MRTRSLLAAASGLTIVIGGCAGLPRSVERLHSTALSDTSDTRLGTRASSPRRAPALALGGVALGHHALLELVSLVHRALLFPRLDLRRHRRRRRSHVALGQRREARLDAAIVAVVLHRRFRGAGLVPGRR